MVREENVPWNDLLQKAKAGKSEARDEIFRELSVKLGLVAQYRLMGWSRQDQEDLVQESLFILLQKLNRVESNPHLYAYEILRNKIGDAMRRRKIIKISLQKELKDDSHPQVTPIAPVSDPEEDDNGFIASIQMRDLIDLLKTAIGKLNPFCRAFFLGILEDRGIEELWAFYRKLEPSLRRGTFNKRIFECRKRLKQLVKDQL